MVREAVHSVKAGVSCLLRLRLDSERHCLQAFTGNMDYFPRVVNNFVQELCS